MFDANFEILTGHPPFPWQRKLHKRFTADDPNNIPRLGDLPTGLGKTSVIAVWLLALLERPERMPRRLVYVVNRRTVVDQTTAEVEKYRRAVAALEEQHPLRVMVERLGISTLRGQFADNHEWSDDPSRPAVICGTVDLIGSRLLFEGYRIGFKSRPLHAGFLGQDALLVHDEAHLESAFQALIETIRDEQAKERRRNGDPPWPGLRVMALSATARSGSENADAFGVTAEDSSHPIVQRRLNAIKTLHLHGCGDDKKLAEQIADLALKHQGNEVAILIFVRKVDDVAAVVERLKKNGVSKNAVETLTGTMRGYERDQLVKSNQVFARFMPPGDRIESVTPAEGTVYLVCTSAGEVGVNLSADHMVCDLSTFDSMAQRLGRVNRFGDLADTRVDVVHPVKFGKADKKTKKVIKSEFDIRRERTLGLLQELNGDASPKALGDLPADQRRGAFAPEPTVLPATDILFDAWALTSIKGKMPGRPPVAPYLHGVTEWEPPRTSVAWRDEVKVINDQLIEHEGQDLPQELLADYPLKPHELLSDRTDRVLTMLQTLAADHADSPVWLVDDQQQIRVSTLGEIANPTATSAQDRRPLERRIAEGVVLLAPSVGGLSAGMLDAASDHAEDVADRWLNENDSPRRERVWDDAPPPTYQRGDETRPMALIRTIDTDPGQGEFAPTAEDHEGELEAEAEAGDEATSKRRRFWHWYARPRDAEDATRASARPIRWQHHTDDVIGKTKQVVDDLELPDELQQVVIIAAELHDLGKQREIWQRSIGNPDPTDWHAKPGRPEGKPRWRPRHLSAYRHELGSVLDVVNANGTLAVRLATLSDEMRDVLLHLVAAHHGYGRPHFPTEAYDHERYDTQQNEHAAHEAMRRYARLQRRYGRWGLAYLESLLRAADWAASANPSDSVSPTGGGA